MRRTVELSTLLTVFLVVLSLQQRALAEEPNLAGLVIQFGDGQVEARCVAFEEDEITGADLLTRSGFTVTIDPSKGLGITVCRIEDEGCDYPADPCFCQCMGGGKCAYWNYFYRDPGASKWAYSALGAAMRIVKPGALEGWVWGDGHTPPAIEFSFETICASPTPNLPGTAGLPTPMPTTASAALPAPVRATISAAPASTQHPTQPPINMPAATATPAIPTPVPSSPEGAGQATSSYWPFGLMVLGLAAVAILVRHFHA